MKMRSYEITSIERQSSILVFVILREDATCQDHFFTIDYKGERCNRQISQRQREIYNNAKEIIIKCEMDMSKWSATKVEYAKQWNQVYHHMFTQQKVQSCEKLLSFYSQLQVICTSASSSNPTFCPICLTLTLVSLPNLC